MPSGTFWPVARFTGLPPLRASFTTVFAAVSIQ